MKSSVVKYEILKIIGERAITIGAGQKIYELLRESFDKDEPVELDFSGVPIVAPPFLNASIGYLYKDYSAEKIEQLLKIEGLTQLGKDTLEIVKEDAHEYYTDERVRLAVDNAMQKRLDETQ